MVIALPEDMLREARGSDAPPRTSRVEPGPARPTWRSCSDCLRGAQRPDGDRSAAAAGRRRRARRCARFAERFASAGGDRFRRQDLFDNRHPYYAGDLGVGVNPELRGAHQVLRTWWWPIGSRLGEVTIARLHAVRPARAEQKLVHVHARRRGTRPGVSGRTLPINAAPTAFAAALEAIEAARGVALEGAETQVRARRLSGLDHRADGRARWRQSSAQSWPGCASNLPDDAILTNGAGNFATWLHRFYHIARLRARQLAPTIGSMGYGVPAAVGMKRLYPERTVVAIAGDGDFLMNGQEFATAVQYGAPIIVLVVSTTACTARSACTRSANIPAGCRRPS